MAIAKEQLKASLVSFLLIFLETGMVNSNPKLCLNIKEIYLESRNRLFPYMPVE